MYKVINKFKDKYTGQIYIPGDNFVSDEPDRVKDLIQRKLIEGVDNTPLNLLTKKELMQLLREKDIEFNERQPKSELIELLGGD